MAAASNPDLAPLVSILSREQSIYGQLLALATDEREAIVARNLPDLKAVLQRKQVMLSRLSDLEDRRVLWLRRYARRHGLDIETVTLADIVEQCPTPERRKLQSLHQALRKRIDQVVEWNRVTSSLLEGILKSIDVSLHFLLAADGAGATYGAQG